MAAPAEEIVVPEHVVVMFEDSIAPLPAQALVKVLSEVSNQGVAEVTLCLMTGGGAIVTGIYLYHVLRGMPFDLTVHAVGDIASAGNIVFVSGEERVAAPHSTFSFHEPTITLQEGEELNVKSLRELAAQLDSNGDRNRRILEERTGLTRNDINALKRRTRTLDADEAVEAGLADRVAELAIPPGALTLQVT